MITPSQFIKNYFNPYPASQDKADREIAERNFNNCLLLVGTIASAYFAYPIMKNGFPIKNPEWFTKAALKEDAPAYAVLGLIGLGAGVAAVDMYIHPERYKKTES